MKSGIRFSPGGNLVAFVEGDEIAVVSVPGLKARGRIATQNLSDFALFDDQVWVVSKVPATLASYAVTGEPITGEIELPQASSGHLRRSPFGPPAALWLGDTLTRITADHDQLEAAAIDGAFDFALPLDSNAIAAAAKNTLWIGQGENPEWTSLPVSLPGAPIDGSSLFEGRTLALVAGEHLIVVATEGGTLLHRLRLRAITAARFSARRGYALLRGGETTLLAIDLRIGRVIKTFDEERRIIDFAIDDGGQHLVLLLAGENGLAEPVYTTFKALLAAEPSDEPSQNGRSAPESRRNAAPGAEEEPEADRDRRSREKARATARRANSEPRRAVEPEVPAEPSGAIEVPPLVALFPRPDSTLADRSLNLRWLSAQIKLIAALCHRAIATAWNSGRLAFEDKGPLPFHSEVPAILGHSAQLAQEDVAHANRQLSEAARAARDADSEVEKLGRLPALLALARELDLSPVALRIILTAAAPSLWGELSRLYGILANDAGRPLVDELLICQISAANQAMRASIAHELAPDQPLCRYGIVRLAPNNRARPFQAITLAPLIVRRIQGDFAAPANNAITVRESDRSLDDLVMPRELLVDTLAALSRTSQSPARLIIRGRLGSGRRTLAAALAAAANRQVGLIDMSLLGDAGVRPVALQEAMIEALLAGLLPCIDGMPDAESLESSDRDRLRKLFRDHPGPLAFRMPPDAAPPIDPGYILADIPRLSETDRVRVWRDTASACGLTLEDPARLASRFRVGPGIARQTCRTVADQPAAQSGGDATDDIDTALRQHIQTRLSTVATRVTRLATWSQIVLPEDIMDSLRELVSRVRHRRTVFEDWGMGQKMSTSRGLTVLFQGPPGTGKTLVAGVIASELALDLYRIDVSRILSKWIGETERNLAAVFDAAEDGQAIILFDEADSLFAKRTEVRSSVDRYANLEVNYLLQRLDSFEGIALLTTNFAGSIDRAFQRRMSLRLQFPFPDEDMREQIWRAHLPPELPTAGDFDFAELAQKYRISGGYIRNAALRAAFLAADEATALTQEHLERAVSLEYREVGKLSDTGPLE